LSILVGEFRSSLRTLFNRADEDRRIARHNQEATLKAFGELRDGTQRSIAELRRAAAEHYDTTAASVDGLRRDLQAQAAAVSEIRNASAAAPEQLPQIAAAQLSRGKIAALASIGLVTLWIIGRVLEAGLTWAVGHLLGLKFGGS
jgi:hypothetical protein